MSHHRARPDPSPRWSSASLACCAAVLLVGACTQPRVDLAQRYTGGPLPPPGRVLVQDFAIDPEEVRVDQGIRARIMRALNDKPLGAEQQEAARQARSTFTATLVQRLRSYGLPAEAASTATESEPGSTVLVQGQIVSVDEGNRTRRTLIGLGAGASSIAVDAQVLYRSGAQRPQLLEAFTASGDSGRAPGMAETMGAGSAAGRLATSALVGAGLHGASERRRAGIDDNARRIADALAPQIGQLFAQLGWIAAPPPTP